MSRYFSNKWLIVIAVIFILSPAKADAPDAPQVKLSPVTPEIEAAVSKAMQNCPPQGNTVIGSVNKNGVYTMTGDIFKNGHIYAIIDNRDSAIICEWQKSQWKPVSSIGTAMEWNRPGLKGDEELGRKPEATKPFWTLTLQHHPLLVVASTMDKYHQNYIVILLDSKCEKILDTVPSYRLLPIVESGYLLTEDDSRNKATWGAAYYSQIQNNRFVTKKSWGEFAPNDAFEGEAFCNFATSNGKSYTVMQDYNKGDHQADFVVFAGKLKLVGGQDIEDAWKHNKAYAKIYFTRQKSKDVSADQDLVEEETVYIFEKLTGLPRHLYPEEDNAVLKGKIESAASIKVEGNVGATRLLSSSRQ